MLRALALAALLAVVPGAAAGQAVGVLHIKITLTDAARASMPVPGHALLISDNPATSAPRRVVTAPDGAVDVRLRPGNYTVESDEPIAFGGRGYQWVQTVDIVAGRDLVLELTAANAEVGAAPAPSVPRENDPSLLRLNGKTASSPSGRRSRARRDSSSIPPALSSRTSASSAAPQPWMCSSRHPSKWRRACWWPIV